MQTIALIQCGDPRSSAKGRTLAEGLYCNEEFKLRFSFAKELGADHIYVLSPAHGLVRLKQAITPDDFDIKELNSEERKVWANNIVTSLNRVHKLKDTFVIFLAGPEYHDDLIKQLPNCNFPFSLRMNAQEPSRQRLSKQAA